MPEFTFEGPNGRTITIEGPEGATREQAIDILRQQHPELWQQQPAPQQRRGRHERHMGDFEDLGRGILQGALDPFEGLAQMMERAIDRKIAPQVIRDWARDWRKQAQGTLAGQAGELLGNVGTAALAPEAGLARGATALAGRIPTMAGWGARAAGRAATGAAAGEMQPVSGDGDYWRTKRNQALGGAFVGAGLPALASAAERTGEAISRAPWWARWFSRSELPGLAAQQAGQAARYAPPQVTGGALGEVIGQVPRNEEERE